MKALYKPIGLILSLAAALVGKRVFNAVWTQIDDEDPPKGTTQQADWSKILAAAAIQGVIFKLVRVVVDRYVADDGIWMAAATWVVEAR